jgi:hypothetical protein
VHRRAAHHTCVHAREPLTLCERAQVKVNNSDVCINPDGFGYASEGASRCAPGARAAGRLLTGSRAALGLPACLTSWQHVLWVHPPSPTPVLTLRTLHTHTHTQPHTHTCVRSWQVFLRSRARAGPASAARPGARRQTTRCSSGCSPTALCSPAPAWCPAWRSRLTALGFTPTRAA